MPAGYEGSPQQYDALRENDVTAPMRDGVRLAADIYRPAIDGRAVDVEFPVLLERTPYDKTAPGCSARGKYFARRGYVCVIQDVRGRFASEGEWYAFAKEAPDGYDTVEWLAAQPWCNGSVGTMGDSYGGSDQSALATLNPPHLSTMVVAVGASNYYHCSMRQNGALEQRFMIYAFRMATTSKEALANPEIKAALDKAFAEVADWVKRAPLKRGVSPLRLVPTYERWALDILQHGEYDDYWKQRGYAISEYYDQHADVPTLYLGGWYDSYARATCENYVALSRAKKSRQVLLMGPWTHGAYETPFAGDLEFGADGCINYNDLRLAWFDHVMKDMRTEAESWGPARLYIMGHGDGSKTYGGRIDHGGVWRDEPDFPLPNAASTPFYLHADGSLSKVAPGASDAEPTRYTFDPRNPVPTIGGGISAGDPIIRPGGYDQVGHPDFFGCEDCLPLNARDDVLTFQTEPLAEDTEVTGPITVTLYASSSCVDTDFTAKLIDRYPPCGDYPDGLSVNVTDSILRARYRNGWERPELMEPGEVYKLRFELYPTANVFRAGHRIRLDVSSSNWPRFDVNPNTGGPLGTERRFRIAEQAVYHDGARPSHVTLPLVGVRG